MQRDLSERTFLITGANTGIGQVTAQDLALRGARVVLACRSVDRTLPVVESIKTAAGHPNVEFLSLDLSDLDSVRRAADGFLARDLPLHGLINNAGVAGHPGLTKQGFELTFGVNHLGHFLLTSLLLERLKQTGNARIVNVSSEAHYRPKGIAWEALQKRATSRVGFKEYAVSKLCNVLFTQELARRLVGSGVAAFALHPGVIASDIWRGVPWPIRPIMTAFMQTTREGARTTLYCATAPELADKSGSYFDACREKRASRYATPELARELWEKSEGFINR
jgi:retinol dehydrogenase-12